MESTRDEGDGTEGDTEEDDDEDGSEEVVIKDIAHNSSTKDLTKKFIYVYQSKFMQMIYRRYGPNLVLLDATYKTTKYVIPLYFLVVQTNVNFQVNFII